MTALMFLFSSFLSVFLREKSNQLEYNNLERRPLSISEIREKKELLYFMTSHHLMTQLQLQLISEPQLEQSSHFNQAEEKEKEGEEEEEE